MRGLKQALVLLFAFALTSVANASDFRSDQIIVKYKKNAIRSQQSMAKFYNAAGVVKVRRYSGMMKGFEQLYISRNVKVQDAIAEMMKSNDVAYAQPNYILRINPVPEKVAKLQYKIPAGGIPCIPGFEIPGCDPNMKLPCLIPGIPFPPGCDGSTPPGDGPTPPPAKRPVVGEMPADVDPPVADPKVSETYGMDKIGAPEAWKTYRGTKEFIVAVIDTGIDYNHEDLAFNVWRNPNPTNGDLVGFDFVHNDGLPYDDNEHGTHTSGTVGAVGGNGVGVSGVAQRISIMGLKFLSGQGSGTTADAIRAIDYAVEHGAKVLSNSWGGKGDDNNKALYEAIERAKAKDVLFVAAAGNDGTDNDGSNPSFPAAFDNDNMLTVAATDKNDAMAFFSNYGKKTTHIAAPGVGIYSTTPGNKYAAHSGTSMACPHVAGAAALLWSKNPTWNYKKVKEVLMESSDKLSALSGKTVSGGRLNITNALRSR